MRKNLRIIEYKIPEDFDGKKIEDFLRFKKYSGRIIKALKDPEGECYGILLEENPARSIDRVKAGQTLTIRLSETEEDSGVIERDIPLDILYEDQDLWIINKPADMPVHPSMGNFDNTLGNALCYYVRHTCGYEPYVERIVNRLDRDTSGALIAAKNALSASILGHALTNREIDRMYFAVCAGDIRKANLLPYFTREEDDVFEDSLKECVMALNLPCEVKEHPSMEEAFKISAPIGRKDGSVIERCVDQKRGENAVTHIRFLRYDSERDLSFVAVKLDTGRTHQIRVHMKYIGHPLIGDFLYHPDFRLIKRHALHSAMLSFRHPITREKIRVFAPLPEDMKTVMEEMKK